MSLSASFKFVALPAVVLAGAALGYKRPEVECIAVESLAPVRAGAPVTIRFMLRNKTARSVKLRPRSTECGTRLEGVPTVLNPRESREIRLVGKTDGQNGPHRFTAGISTDANLRLVSVTADADIYADWVVRRVALGRLPAQIAVEKRIRIDNVPSCNLVRVGDPAQRGWSARVGETGERFIEVDLASTPQLKPDQFERRISCDFSLYFADADVRRVQVLATGVIAADAPRSRPNLSRTAGRGP